MDLLFITRKWPPAVGGMETYSVRLAEYLDAHTQMELIALPGREDGSPPSSLSILGFGAKVAWRAVTSRRQTDAVLGGDLSLWPLVWLAGLRHRRAGMHFAVHGSDIAYADRPGWKPWAYRQYLGLASVLLRSASFIANSQATARKLERRGFRDPQIVPLAAEAPESFFAAKPARYVLFVGRLLKQKGCGWFVQDVLPQLPADISVKIAGTIVDQDEAGFLKHPQVEFLGPVYGEELAELRANALAVIVPNIDTGPCGFEGFGLTAPEASMAGAVVVAARLHGLTDAVMDGETGFLLTPGDVRAWVSKIEKIAAWTGEERDRFTSKARARARAYYTWDRVGSQTLAILAGAKPVSSTTVASAGAGFLSGHAHRDRAR